MITKRHNNRTIFIALILLIFMILFVIFIKGNNFKNESSTGQLIEQRINDTSIFSSKVVFYPQHQDDEVLWAGSAMINAINKCGKDNVYVVLVSGGSGVNVFKNNPKFKNLTKKEKEELRNDEFKRALKDIGIKDKNIIFLAKKSKKRGPNFKLLKETILDFEAKFDGDVTHIAHNYKYDNHQMHRINGTILKRLKDSEEINNAFYFIKPQYAEKIDESDRFDFVVNNKKEYKLIKNACDEYIKVDERRNKYGIGYKSAPNYFKHLLNDPNLTSIITKK